MAAHLKTGIFDILSHTHRLNDAGYVDTLRAAVNYDCFTSDDHDTWLALNTFVEGKITADELEEKLWGRLAWAIGEWERLGQPRTREEWWDKILEEK